MGSVIEEVTCELRYQWITPSSSVIHIYRNRNVVIMTKFVSPAALKVVVMTTSDTSNEEKFVETMMFSFHSVQVDWVILGTRDGLVLYFPRRQFIGNWCWRFHEVQKSNKHGFQYWFGDTSENVIQYHWGLVKYEHINELHHHWYR